MSVTWRRPSRLTVFTMYSDPTRYSWASTCRLRLPSALSVPINAVNAARTASASSQKYTPSLPALFTGFTTTRLPASAYQSRTVSRSMARICFVPGTPAARMVSIIWYLSRRARLPAVPLVRRPSASLSSSACSTPLSMPGITHTGW